jgi:hypothetical protein
MLMTSFIFKNTILSRLLTLATQIVNNSGLFLGSIHEYNDKIIREARSSFVHLKGESGCEKPPVRNLWLY